MFGLGISRLGKAGRLSLAARAIAILRRYGTNAHLYLPGVGVINGVTAGNYLDSAGTTAATVDGLVGLVTDSLGAVNASQATSGSRPTERRGMVNLALNSKNAAGAAWAANAVAAETTTAEASVRALKIEQRFRGRFCHCGRGTGWVRFMRVEFVLKG